MEEEKESVSKLIERIKAKIMWMIKYFNSWFTKYERRLLNQQKITKEEIEEIIA